MKTEQVCFQVMSKLLRSHSWITTMNSKLCDQQQQRHHECRQWYDELAVQSQLMTSDWSQMTTTSDVRYWNTETWPSIQWSATYYIDAWFRWQPACTTGPAEACLASADHRQWQFMPLLEVNVLQHSIVSLRLIHDHLSSSSPSATSR